MISGRPAYQRLDIQGLRAIAVMLVVAYHAGLPMPGGFVGVDMFFVISGYVITLMLLREWQATGSVRLGRFYLQRFRRLTPALATVLIVTILVSALLLSPLGSQQIVLKTAVGALTLTANLVIVMTSGGYFDADPASNPLLHTWSLSVEEQFYVVLPALLVAALWLSKSRRRPFGLVVLAVVSVSAISLLVTILGSMQNWLPGIRPELMGFYSPVTRTWEFGVGALLAIRLASAQPTASRLGPWSAWLGLALIAISTLVISDRTVFPGVWTLLPVIGTSLLLVGGEMSNGEVSRLLGRFNMVRLGDMSYSIYLWHWPAISVAAAVWPASRIALAIAAVASLVPAALAFRWVETPMRRIPVDSLSAVVRFVGLTIVPVACVLGAIWFACSSGYWLQTVRDAQQQVLTPHTATAYGCDTALTLPAMLDTGCTWNAKASGPPIYLVGDSHAGHLSEGVMSAATNLRRRLIISTANACPFVGAAIENRTLGTRWNLQCASYIKQTLDWLRSAPAGTVVIANASNYWSNDNLIFRWRGERAESTLRRRAIYSSALAFTIKELRLAGHRVLLVQDTPSLNWSPLRCSLYQIARGSCNGVATASSVLRSRANERVTMGAVALESGAKVLDLIPRLCPSGRCEGVQAGKYLYRDGNHLSVSGSLLVAGVIQAALSS